MVGMAMREPVILRIPDRLKLCRRDLVVKRPAAEIGIPAYLWVGCEHRPTIVSDYDRVADCLKEPHSVPPFCNFSQPRAAPP
jgi:hypothetical protein